MNDILDRIELKTEIIMTCSIRKAVRADEQRICELFIEMLQTIYHTDDVHGYDPGYLDRYSGSFRARSFSPFS